jgi:hypothetical protein
MPVFEAFSNGEDIEGGPIDLDHWQGIDADAAFEDETQRFRIASKPREFWLDTLDFEVLEQEKSPNVHKKDSWIKVREVLDEDV